VTVVVVLAPITAPVLSIEAVAAPRVPLCRIIFEWSVDGLCHLYSACDHSISTNSTLYNANPDHYLSQEYSDLSRTALTSLTMSETSPTPVEDLPDASAAPTECTYDESLK